MANFNVLQDKYNEKIDLIRVAIENYTSPYRVEGYDAVTLNNLTEFISNNIIYKERKEYEENELSDIFQKYTYRYFTHFVNSDLTYNIMENILLYNKYMVDNILTNPLDNIFSIREKFRYRIISVNTDHTSISNPLSKTFNISIDYKNRYKEIDPFVFEFKLRSDQIDNEGKIINLNGIRDIISDFELNISELDENNNVVFNDIEIRDNNGKFITTLNLEQYGNVEYDTSVYINNILNNMFSDFTNLVNEIKLSPETKNDLINKGATISDEVLFLSNKKKNLLESIEILKTTNVLRNILIKKILTYVQSEQPGYIYPITEFSEKFINHLKDNIKYLGYDVDEWRKPIASSYNQTHSTLNITNEIGIFEAFLKDIFFWYINDNDPTDVIETNVNILGTKYISNGSLVYDDFIKEIINHHLEVYLYKNLILMDIKLISEDVAISKENALNKHEINQISDNKPLIYVNVIHRLNRAEKRKFRELFTEYEVIDSNSRYLMIDERNNPKLDKAAIEFTFQYKEVKEDVYELFFQDQIETYVANWLYNNGAISSLFSDIYNDTWNESVFTLSTNLDVNLYTITDITKPNYYKKAKRLVGNVINFREKNILDIAGYYLDSYLSNYYGMKLEERQEISLYIRSYQDVREYYFKNLLLKSLVNEEMYPLYEYILLVTMAIDRYFNQRIAKHKDIDSYNEEDLMNFLNSFGLSELNKYEKFANSFDYKLAVVRNYNNLIKNKGTRRVRGLIENIINETSTNQDIKINEYYLVKSTRDSINYVEKFYDDDKIYTWNGTSWDIDNVEDHDMTDKYIMLTYFYKKGSNTGLYIFKNIEDGWVKENNIQSDNKAPEGYPVWSEGMFINTATNELYLFDNIRWVLMGTLATGSTLPEATYYWDSEINTIGYAWYDKDNSSLIEHIVNPYSGEVETWRQEILPKPTEITFDSNTTPEDIALMKYEKEKDDIYFVNIREGNPRPISTISNKVKSNALIDYDVFISDDDYWEKSIDKQYISDPEKINLNIAKTKYMSISASINMETAKIMNMYVMSILDNLLEKMVYDPSVENYTDDIVGSLSDIKFSDLIKWIKFINYNMGSIVESNDDVYPSVIPFTGKYYGVPSMRDIIDDNKIDYFVTELKKIITGINEEHINEFLYDKINFFGEGSEQLSMNRYKYNDNINKYVTLINGSQITDRNDGTKSDSSKEENTFARKLKRVLLGLGYSQNEFQNSAVFILDFLESTNLLTIIEKLDASDEIDTTEGHYNTTTKYLKLLEQNSISSQEVNINNLYKVNLEYLLLMLKDYTENKIFQEDYSLKDSTITNVLAINNSFVDIINLIIETFFERDTSVYYIEELQAQITSGVIDPTLPDFITEFISDLITPSTVDEEKMNKAIKYNNVLNSLIKILSFITSWNDFSLLENINTVNKNFSDSEYFDFLISLLSFFMSYKVTLYEESHQFDLSNKREVIIFAESLEITSTMNLEENWFFDTEITEIEEVE